MINPPALARDTYRLMTPKDRAEVASPCWRDGIFDAWGDVWCCICEHQIQVYGWWPNQEPKRGDCHDEFLCEAIAAVLLIPRWRDAYNETHPSIIADRHECEQWAVRFRGIIERTHPTWPLEVWAARTARGIPPGAQGKTEEANELPLRGRSRLRPGVPVKSRIDIGRPYDNPG